MVLRAKHVSAIRAKRVGYYKRSKEVYFKRSNEGNASKASNLIKRAKRGCGLPSEARKCIAREVILVILRAKREGYCEQNEQFDH